MIRNLHHWLFTAIYRYLQSLQDQYPVNLGPALDELEVLHARVVDGYDPDCDTHPNARFCLEQEVGRLRWERDTLLKERDELQDQLEWIHQYGS